MKGEHPILRISVALSAAVAAQRFVTPGGALPAAGGRTLGVSMVAGAQGDLVAVTALGVATCIAAGAIGVGDAVAATNTGKAAKVAANQATVATALTAAANDGDEIQLLLVPN